MYHAFCIVRIPSIFLPPDVLVRADDVRAVNGLSLGSLSSNAHSVSGKLYVVDARRLRLVDFNYDGTAPGKAAPPGARRVDKLYEYT